MRKGIDRWRGGGLVSRAATTEGGRETECRSRSCRSLKKPASPDRLFSPLEGSKFFDSAAPGNWREWMRGLEKVPLSLPAGNMPGAEDKRLNCALRWGEGLEALNPARKPEGGSNSIWPAPRFKVGWGLPHLMSKSIFTESLILAQNERWRRV